MNNLDRIREAVNWQTILLAAVIALVATLTYLTIFYLIQGG